MLSFCLQMEDSYRDILNVYRVREGEAGRAVKEAERGKSFAETAYKSFRVYSAFDPGLMAGICLRVCECKKWKDVNHHGNFYWKVIQKIVFV